MASFSASTALLPAAALALASAGRPTTVSEARVEETGALGGGLLASEVDTEFKVCYKPGAAPGAAPSTLKLNDLKGKVVVLQSAPSNCPAVYDQNPAYSLCRRDEKGPGACWQGRVPHFP